MSKELLERKEELARLIEHHSVRMEYMRPLSPHCL